MFAWIVDFIVSASLARIKRDMHLPWHSRPATVAGSAGQPGSCHWQEPGPWSAITTT